jgi:hypothetical protein
VDLLKKEAAGAGGRTESVETPIVLAFVDGKKDIKTVEVPARVEKKQGFTAVSRIYPIAPGSAELPRRIVLSDVSKFCVAKLPGGP